MKKWNEENPGRAKEAMTQVHFFFLSSYRLHWHSCFALQIALLWKDAPENPNRGQGPKARKPKAPKEPKEPKAPAEPKAKTKKAKKTKKAEVEEEDAENSDPVEANDDEEWLMIYIC